MKKSKMNAVTLRGILVTVIVLLIILAGVGFYFAENWLSSLAISVSHTVASSATSDNSVQSLQKLQSELAGEQDIITKTNSLITSTSTYQTQAVQDLIAYAAATGITISNYSFPAVAAATPTNTIPSTQVSVTLTSPISYISLLKFMNDIESNLPKMQIITINLARIDGDSSSVSVSELTIAVYAR
jgi:hypothetical protein